MALIEIKIFLKYILKKYKLERIYENKFQIETKFSLSRAVNSKLVRFIDL
jgi:hypothetical protein